MITYLLLDRLEKYCFRMSNLHYELENRLKLDSSVSANSRIARRKEVRIYTTTVTIVGLAKADKSFIFKRYHYLSLSKRIAERK